MRLFLTIYNEYSSNVEHAEFIARYINAVELECLEHTHTQEILAPMTGYWEQVIAPEISRYVKVFDLSNQCEAESIVVWDNYA